MSQTEIKKRQAKLLNEIELLAMKASKRKNGKIIKHSRSNSIYNKQWGEINGWLSKDIKWCLRRNTKTC